MAAESDYRFRGVSLSDSKPGLHATLNVDAPGGAYGGVSLTRAALTPAERYTQVLGYAGWVTPAGGGRHVEIGASFAHFVGNASYDYAEAFFGLLAERWQLRAYVAPDYFGRDTATLYVEGNLQHPLGEQLRAFGHLGTLLVLHAPDGTDKSTRADVRVGLGWTQRHWDLQIAGSAVTPGGPYPAQYRGRRSTVIVSVAYSF